MPKPRVWKLDLSGFPGWGYTNAVWGCLSLQTVNLKKGRSASESLSLLHFIGAKAVAKNGTESEF